MINAPLVLRMAFRELAIACFASLRSPPRCDSNFLCADSRGRAPGQRLLQKISQFLSSTFPSEANGLVKHYEGCHYSASWKRNQMATGLTDPMGWLSPQSCARAVPCYSTFGQSIPHTLTIHTYTYTRAHSPLVLVLSLLCGA